MAETVRGALRDRVSYRAVVSWVALLGVLLWVFDEPIVQVGTTVVSAAVLGTAELLSDVYDLRSEIGSLGYGLVVVVSATALGVFGDGSVWVPLVLVGAWITLDSGQTLRHEGLTTDEKPDRDGHEVYQEYVTRQADRALRERALTRRELFDTLEADDAAIDRALATLDERGLLSRQGSELRISSPAKPGALGRVRDGIGRGAKRLARPLTVEFEDETADDTTTTPQPRDEVARGDEREREPAGRH